MTLTRKKPIGRYSTLMLESAALLILLFLGGPAPAQPTSKETQKTSEIRATARMTISEVAAEYNLIYVTERAFRVAPEAAVLDGAGNEISLKELSPPFQAMVTYVLTGGNQHPLVTGIKVIGRGR